MRAFQYSVLRICCLQKTRSSASRSCGCFQSNSSAEYLTVNQIRPKTFFGFSPKCKSVNFHDRIIIFCTALFNVAIPNRCPGNTAVLFYQLFNSKMIISVGNVYEKVRVKNHLDSSFTLKLFFDVKK